MSGSSIVTQLAITSVVAFLLVGSLLGLLLGIGLLVKARAVLPFIHLMNQWVSTRQALKSLEQPRQVGAAASGARWFGAVLVALGAFSAAILLGRLDPAAVASLLKVDGRTSLLGMLLEALRWFLVLGSLGAVVTGVMLLFFPRTWRRVEERANRWYSTRSLEIAGDALHPPLDRIVEAFPRASGAVLVALSVVAAASCAMLLFSRS